MENQFSSFKEEKVHESASTSPGDGALYRPLPHHPNAVISPQGDSTMRDNSLSNLELSLQSSCAESYEARQLSSTEEIYSKSTSPGGVSSQSTPSNSINSFRSEPKGPPQACLFVASLSPETTERQLREIFSVHAEVLKLKLLKDRNQRPYAFVQYAEVEDADRTLQDTNGIMLDGRRLRVEKAKVNRTLFVAKLNRSINTQTLRDIVEEYGLVESVTIIKNHQTNKSKGCGFVKYVYREDAMEAFIGLKTKQKKWIVEWATSKNDPDILGVDKCNIFIGGINAQLITKEALVQRFSTYGELESVTIINKGEMEQEFEDGTKAGAAFAFIRYKDPASSAMAIEHENGQEWHDRRVRVQYCESREIKYKRRAAKMTQIGNTNDPYFSVPPPMYMNMMGMYNLPMARLPMGMDGTVLQPIPPPYVQNTFSAYPLPYSVQYLYPTEFDNSVMEGIPQGYPLSSGYPQMVPPPLGQLSLPITPPEMEAMHQLHARRHSVPLSPLSFTKFSHGHGADMASRIHSDPHDHSEAEILGTNYTNMSL